MVSDICPSVPKQLLVNLNNLIRFLYHTKNITLTIVVGKIDLVH